MQYHHHRPFFEKGIGVERISFSGGRLAADMVRHGGLTRIIYFGNQRGGDAVFFHADALSAWVELFRPMVRFDGGGRSVLEFNDTTVFPNGYESFCELEGVRFKHELILGNREMLFRLTVVAGGAARKLAFELINSDTCTREEKPVRRWEKLATPFPAWKVIDHYPEAEVAAEQRAGYLTLAQRGDKFEAPSPHSETFFGVAASGEIAFQETPWLFRKHYYSQPLGANGTASFVLGFGHDGQAEFLARLAALAEAPEAHFRFPDGAGAPSFHSGEPVMDSFLANAPDILRSLAVADVPGGMRAADSGYWIWGWDAMVWADGFAQLNQLPLMAEVLDFYCRTADPERGIFHEMHPDLRPYKSMAFAPQCLYAVMLYQYWVYSGDADTVARYLPFAEAIVRRAGESEVRHSGLLSGVSLYPDHPEDLDQDGDDISVFNNGIYYQALRALEELERESDDAEKAAHYRTLAQRTRDGFERFYDAGKGYFFDSLSGRDFAPRRHYPVYAILYVTEFADELLRGKRAAVAEFMSRKFATRYGARILPLDDDAFMRDGNQLGMYMPSTERFFREMCHALDPAANRAKFQADIIANWRLLTLPEALTCEYENHGVTPDNPGRKQFFTLKPWVGNWFKFALGIECTPAGIGFRADAEPGTAAAGLRWRGKDISIRNTGGAGKVNRLQLNGETVPGTARLQWQELPARAEIVVFRDPGIAI